MGAGGRFPHQADLAMKGTAGKTGAALGTRVRMYNYVRTDSRHPDSERTGLERTDMTHTGSCR